MTKHDFLAPQPRKKEGRAARLYATLTDQPKNGDQSEGSDQPPDTPVDADVPVELGNSSGPMMIAANS